MNFLELNKKAKEIATKSLERNFDWQAFLVLSQAVFNEERMGNPVDLVPDSKVDEGINYLLTLFVDYINTKKSFCAGPATADEVAAKLQKYLAQNTKIMKELSLSCDSAKEKEILKEYIKTLSRID